MINFSRNLQPNLVFVSSWEPHRRESDERGGLYDLMNFLSRSDRHRAAGARHRIPNKLASSFSNVTKEITFVIFYCIRSEMINCSNFIYISILMLFSVNSPSS